MAATWPAASSPETTSAAIAGDAAALARIDRVVRARMRDGSVARIKIWEANGRVVYSDEPSLIGHTYPLPAAVSAVLDGQRGVAEIADDADPENALEHDPDGLVEVYVPAVASTGEHLVFETYFPETAVRRVQHDLLAQMAPVALTALVVLSLAQLPPALRLARRVQRGRRSRERLLAQTVAAGDLERRRLAADLDDQRHPGPRGRRICPVLDPRRPLPAHGVGRRAGGVDRAPRRRLPP